MPAKNKIKQQPWTDADRRAFAEQRLRAIRIPNKKREASRKACRGRIA